MKILILYTTRHGCTEKCAEKLRGHLTGEVDVVNLKSAGSPALTDYETVLIGGSIHVGQVQKKIRNFCLDHEAELKQKTLGLFLCCMEEGKKAQEQFDAAFSEGLRAHAAAQGLFGGEFGFDRMNFLERKIVKKVAGVEGSVSRISEEAIERFAADLVRNPPEG
jgi:menaquinone-dependent protoporphyrinogen oxidase